MDPDQRKPYSEEAKKEKEWHKQMYPDYVYRAPGPSNPNEKIKNFKIKVKMGNPAKARRATPPSQDRVCCSPDLSSGVTCSNGDIEIVGVPRLWHDQQRQYLLQTHIGAEHDFVPTECIPPLELCSSNPIEQEDVGMKLKVRYSISFPESWSDMFLKIATLSSHLRSRSQSSIFGL